MKTLVLGLGNPILTDDGVGVRVAEAIREALPPDTSIDVSEASVGGLRLMERVLGYDRVILIDALHNNHNHPGVIHRMTLEDLRDISPTFLNDGSAVLDHIHQFSLCHRFRTIVGKKGPANAGRLLLHNVC